ncbi:MAG: aminotransferase class V-fold PLP-dependent enzyme [Myxococcales bacterium]|nr:aminotransferase class V-fold PLP-dependent enzyme [Myxococcales bacterium]MCB9575742.1 aminotransferase class V-fold PLP-dependent enzyme [Polyangiaceae bacterium]
MSTARLSDRSLFPDLEAKVYANHAAVSPPSAPVVAAAQRALSDVARRGVGAVHDWVAQRTRLKGRLADLIGMQAEDVGLVSNTTRGVTDVALCFPWRSKDRVVVFAGEFPANVTPWQRAAELFDLEVRMLSTRSFEEDPEAGLAAVRAELEGGARLVAVSVVEFSTGLRMPTQELAALCHEYGAELFVDAIQALGVVPLNMREEGIDYLTCGSHKWLMGLEGAGFVAIAPERVAALRPYVAGWLSHEQPLEFLFSGAGHLRYDRPIRKSADFLEGGAQNAVGFAALEAAVELIAGLGVPQVFAHVSAWLDALEPALVERGFQSRRSARPEQRSGTLSLLPPPGVDVTALHQRLTAAGVSCSMPDGLLRFSPHWPNASSEIDVILKAL